MLLFYIVQILGFVSGLIIGINYERHREEDRKNFKAICYDIGKE